MQRQELGTIVALTDLKLTFNNNKKTHESAQKYKVCGENLVDSRDIV